MSTSDHDKLGKASGGRTMQLDALPEELLEGIAGEDSGYQLADEGQGGPSAPPPLPPQGSAAPAPAPAAAGDSKKTMIIAVVVAVLMAIAGVLVGTMVLGEDEEAAPAAPPPSIELGDIEVDSH